jgi:hypothetical protein
MMRRLWVAGLIASIAGCGGAGGGAGARDPGAAAAAGAAPSPSARLDELRPDSELEIAEVDADRARRLETGAIQKALAGLEEDEASMDIVADPNMRPIHVWFVKGESGVRAVHAVGHADGECCALISGLIQDVATRTGFEDAWFSYGYGDLVATTAAEEQQLDKLRGDITSKASSKACAGQVVLETQDTDSIAASSAGLTAMGEKAYARAKELGRPLMIWNQFDDHPRIVPALVAEGGALRPLRFKVTKSDLAIPASVSSGFSMSGVAQAIASLEAETVYLTGLSKATNLLSETSKRGWTTNYRADNMEPAVLAADARIAAGVAHFQALPAADPNRIKMLPVLRGMQATNALALKQIRALPLHATSDKGTKIDYSDFALAEEAVANARTRLVEVQASMARLRAMEASPLSRPEPVLTDALLRGWPASFSTPKIEGEFDKWAAQRQTPVWANVTRDLEARGVHFAAGAAGAPAALTLSNVVFRVEESGGDMAVTPYFILAGPVVQVVDPDARIVRYEASAADQNLHEIRKGASK